MSFMAYTCTGVAHDPPAAVSPGWWQQCIAIVEDYRGDTYRAACTVRLLEAVYVLHVFQKKSKHGVATPKSDLDLIKERLKRAREFHATWKR